MPCCLPPFQLFFSTRASPPCPFSGCCSHHSVFFSQKPPLCWGYLWNRSLYYILFLFCQYKNVSHAAERRNKEVITMEASNLNHVCDVQRAERRLDLDCCSLNVKPERDTKDALLRLCTFLRVKSKAFNSSNTAFMIWRHSLCSCAHIRPLRRTSLDYLEAAVFTSSSYRGW